MIGKKHGSMVLQRKPSSDRELRHKRSAGFSKDVFYFEDGAAKDDCHLAGRDRPASEGRV
jgi:hypothetical protein